MHVHMSMRMVWHPSTFAALLASLQREQSIARDPIGAPRSQLSPMATISLDSDDEDDACVRVAGLGTSKDAPLELSDDDDDAPTAGSSAGAADSSQAGSQSVPSPATVPSTNTAAGCSTSSLVMDLTGEEEDVPGCGICGKLTGARESFRLAECGHSFCEGCVRGFVRKKVAETLAHEVGCPKCGRQLSIANVNELAKSSGEPGAKRPRPGGPAAWRGGGPAALLAQLTGGGGGLPGVGQAGRRAAGNPAATKRIMRELQALPAPCLHPACTLPAPCLHPACTLPAPSPHPPCTAPAPPAPCVHPACTAPAHPPSSCPQLACTRPAAGAAARGHGGAG